MSLNTTRGNFSYMEGTDLASDIDQGFENLAQRIADVGVLFSQGVFASRPAAAAWGGGGALYLATDTSVLYYTDGTAWFDLQDLLPPTEIVNADVAAGAGIVDTKLASPNNSTYKLVDRIKTILSAIPSTSTNYLTSSGYAASGSSHAGAIQVSNTLRIDASDFAVNGMTTKMRVKVATQTGGDPVTVTTTFGLYPITATVIGAGFIGQTLGSVVSGSTIAIVSSGTSNTLANGNSGDFTIPSDGYYCLGFATSGTPSPGSQMMVDCALEVRNV